MSDRLRLRDDVPSWFLDAMSMPAEVIRAMEDRETPREPGWAEGPNLNKQSDYHWALERFRGERMDPGIVHVVRVFQEHGIETCQSCQGGNGHSYEYPTVEIYGQPWKALDVANDYGMPVVEITHRWRIEAGAPTDPPVWSIVFSPTKLAQLRQGWYADEARERAEYLAWLAAHPTEASS